MLLTPEDAFLYFRLHKSLMFFVNQRLGAVPDRPANPQELGLLPLEKHLKIRDALLQHRDLIQAFVDENPLHMPDDELDIIRSWRHLVHGKFYILRELKNYTVFLSDETPAVAYGVVALTDPIEKVVGPDLPVLIETVLLPFKGRIVYEGLVSNYNISFGGNFRRSLNESYNEAKERYGIVTSLPRPDAPLPPRPPKAKPAPKKAPKEQVADVLRTITDMTDRFCREQLNDEYAVLCRKMAEKLARKRPSPLLSGRPNTWAAGIVRTVGWVNFLHDKTQTPHMRLSDIDQHFGASEASGAAKSSAIRKMFKLHLLDPNWTLPSRLEDNPMAWMVTVNGFVMDVRDAPREVQEIAFQKGLIPYIPADREQGE